MRRIDLNADVGESLGPWRLGDDEALLDVVTSANIACGFHAGDPCVMEATVRAAAARGVAIGAHPGYPDLGGFGRRSMRIAPGDVARMVLYQIGALGAFCRGLGARMAHVKPHGALYNDAAEDPDLAAAIASAAGRYDSSLIVVGLAGSAMAPAVAAAGLRFAAEAFCDRAYRPNGALEPRAEPGATLQSAAEACAQAIDIALRGRVVTPGGDCIDVAADTLCIHGDTPRAPDLARAVRAALLHEGVTLSAL
ncbi:MAG: 5-oxoprolinase subunit PxpA [Candidatus Eremiobacteraeota bacterium]|nr:5-oxoprolinase subunit PxpA [Candidatus Eremiobacteraeota bacterium]